MCEGGERHAPVFQKQAELGTWFVKKKKKMQGWAEGNDSQIQPKFCQLTLVGENRDNKSEIVVVSEPADFSKGSILLIYLFLI